MRAWLRIFLMFLLLPGALAVRLPVSAQAATGLDVLVALDISGSMSQTITMNTRRDDSGPTRLLTDRDRPVSAVNATDPDNQRFEVTQLLLRWLADFAARQPGGLDVSASVVTFHTEAQTLLPWQRLSPDRPVTLRGIL